MTFGEKLKKKRIEKDMSQEDLAKKISFGNRSTISNWEKDRTEPNIENLWKLSKCLDCTVDYLINPNE